MHKNVDKKLPKNNNKQTKVAQLKLCHTLFFAIFDNHNIIVKRFDKIVGAELGVVESDKIDKVSVQHYGSRQVKLVTNISQNFFEFFGRVDGVTKVYFVLDKFVVREKSNPNFHNIIVRKNAILCQDLDKKFYRRR